MTYKEKLLDPRWKEKRFQVLERDGYKCKYCERTKNLQVHHLTYSTEEPWDSPFNELITLCAKCHQKIHEKAIKEDKQPFVMQFISSLKVWIGLSNTAKNILAVLCTKSVYNTNRVSLTKHVRDEICEMCSIQPQSLANTLQELKKKEIITIDRGECYISYNYFWKGDLKTREQLLRNGSMTVNIEFERE